MESFVEKLQIVVSDAYKTTSMPILTTSGPDTLIPLRKAPSPFPQSLKCHEKKSQVFVLLGQIGNKNHRTSFFCSALQMWQLRFAVNGACFSEDLHIYKIDVTRSSSPMRSDINYFSLLNKITLILNKSRAVKFWIRVTDKLYF